mmetsp:Transcript_19596/g.45680  ORF Transcript_19596/g.45680 Transcript_19596/m.45680 type:complete len:675 (-) Transcript_19596:40-2064(-)
MITASDEAPSTIAPSGFYFCLERFLQDDGSICLGFLIVIFAIRQSISYATRTRSRSANSSNSSSSGLHSSSSSNGTTTTTVSTTNSGLSNMSGSSGSSGGGGANHKGSRSDDGETFHSSSVPIRRALFWLALTSVLGLIWGMQFSDSAQVRILVGTVAPFWLRLETGSQTSEGTIPSLSNISQTEEPTLLELYLKEHAERMISLPKFSAIDAEREAANERRKSLAEFIVHPVLLVSGTEEHPDEPSETVAVAVNMDSGSIDAQTNGIELAEDLVQEITRYRNIEKISILLVSSEATAKEGCPRELKNLPSSVPVDCIHIDPNWGNEKNGHIEKLLPADGFDVSIVLSGCDVSDPKDRIWEKELYAFTDSVVSTCTGPRRTRPLNSLGVSVKSLRVWTIDALFLEIESGEDAHPYSKIIDYDFQGLNMAVAFHNNMNKVFYKWHCNEANYNNELSSRLKPGSREDLHHFEGADMLRIQFPSKYSANSFCDYLEEYGELDEDEEYQCSSGYDPDSINIPIDQIYVRQSTSGENAGRGVFTSVDLLEAGTMIGMETNIHSVYYPPLCKAIVEGIVDLTVYESFEDENDDDDDEEEEELRQTRRSIPRLIDAGGSRRHRRLLAEQRSPPGAFFHTDTTRPRRRRARISPPCSASRRDPSHNTHTHTHNDLHYYYSKTI